MLRSPIVNALTRLILTAATLALAMPRATSADVFSPWVGERPQDLRVTLSSRSTGATTNSDKVLSVTLKNAGTFDLHYYDYPPISSYDLSVRDSKGDLVTPNHRAPEHLVTAWSPGLLRAGATREYAIFYSLNDWGYELPAGTYVIRASARFAAVKSNPVTIVVAPVQDFGPPVNGLEVSIDVETGRDWGGPHALLTFTIKNVGTTAANVSQAMARPTITVRDSSGAAVGNGPCAIPGRAETYDSIIAAGSTRRDYLALDLTCYHVVSGQTYTVSAVTDLYAHPANPTVMGDLIAGGVRSNTVTVAIP